MSAVTTFKDIPINTSAEPRSRTDLPNLQSRLTEELVIALVGPVGSGCSTTGQTIGNILQIDYNYQVTTHVLSSFITQHANLVQDGIEPNATATSRITALQRIGDRLRHACGHGYLAAKAVEAIAKDRETDGFGRNADGGNIPLSRRRVHIIDSLKNPEELKVLRDAYGRMLWVFGVFAPESVRKVRLEHDQKWVRADIQEIVDRDYREAHSYGQNVRDVFNEADFFVRNDQDNQETLRVALQRYLEILFGVPVHTPTQDESAMAAAYAEGSKSACLSRQVGSAIASPQGELIGLGRNDVPKYTGGLYGEDDQARDHRCFKWSGRCCHNDDKKNSLYKQIADKLSAAGLLASPALTNQVIEELRKTDVRSLIEYSRAVHAEMDAIVSVARSNKTGLLGGTMYVTTFPCHACARHIVASGIVRVLYIEPYPKSLALDLHRDSVSDNEAEAQTKVVFLQYSGVAPKNMLTFFSARLTRKSDDGKLVEVDKRTAKPVVAVSLDDISTHEQIVVAEYAQNERKAHGEQTTLFGPDAS
ncbi:anti-phage dCTP deaminase [Burkholderia glumae]